MKNKAYDTVGLKNSMLKYLEIGVMVLILILCLSTPVWAVDTPLKKQNLTPTLNTARYVIGPGDILEIAEWKNPDLTKTVVVLPDGMITFPLLGEIQAAGKTAGQLSDGLSQELKQYIPSPNVSIIVQQVKSLIVYVIGKVNKPGQFLVNSRVSVLQALAMAGGLNSFAESDCVRVFRSIGEKTKIFEVDYDAVSKGHKLDQNIMLQRGDVVVVR